MPRARAATRPPPRSPEDLALREARRRWRPLLRWEKAVHEAAWRTAFADNRGHCTAAHFDRARQILIDQGRGPPAGFEDWA